ncbi:MAG TPA: immunoglobulin domain-containing protein, partial [Vicinamibacterales bacterium]|nr:immunoglobulin domain-containing protein [Vicinamibacterales bacterium]
MRFISRFRVPSARVLATSIAAAAALTLLALAGRHVQAATSFTPGNLVVVRMGDGGAALSSAAAPVFLDEYATAGGAPVQTVAMPTAVSGANVRFTDSGSASSDGSLNRSADGRYLTLAGYDADAGTAGVVASAAARVVARVSTDGTVDTSTRLTDGYGANNIRSAVSDDGSRFWTAGTGAGGGTRVVSLGAGTSLQVSGSVTNTRIVSIYSGQLYTSSASGAFQGVSSVGTGLPATSGQATTILPGFPTASGPSSYGFALLDLNSAVLGVDTAYVADDRSAASGGGLQKWTFNGATWSLAYTINTGASGARSVVADTSGANVVLYATTGESSANKLVSIADAGAASAMTTLAIAGTNKIFRGVAFAPQSGPAITQQPVGTSIVAGQSANLVVVASGTPTLTYQWYVGTSGDTSSPISGAMSSSFTTPVQNATGTFNYWVRVANSLGHADSNTATVTVTAAALPTITQQPQSQTINAGNSAALTVQASSGTPLSYQWFIGVTGDLTNPVSGAVASSFTTPPLSV